MQALFCDDGKAAAEWGRARGGRSLWRPYRKLIDGKCADLNNVAPNAFAGPIIGALHLAEFVSKAKNWAHLDIMASNTSPKPGRPEGGEATGMRGMNAYVSGRFG